MRPDRHYRFPWRAGNHFKFLIDSTEFFPRTLETIDAARQYMLLEMYLVASGEVVDRLIQALLEAAERGVRIYLLLDDYGSQQLTQHDRTRLVHPNIQIAWYNPLVSYNTFYNLYKVIWQHIPHSLYRNHRKLLLVDGNRAFVGGAGITDAVASLQNPALRWRETVLEIQGPVVADWQQLFTESWNRSATQALNLPAVTSAAIEDGQKGRVTVNEARRRMGIQRSLLKQTQSARARIWFATAYFFPSWKMRRKLKRAASKGVDVRLLLPGPVTDHPGARYASHRYYSSLLKSGIRIYEYTPRFFHAKTVLCDDWVSIGSCNFDRWNLHWNLEANQEIDDPEMAATVATLFNDDFANSLEHTQDEWRQRGWHLRSLEWLWRRVELLSLKYLYRRRR